MENIDKQYNNNYKKYITAATLDNAANKIMSSTFIVGYAIFLGLSDRIIGLYVALKSIMCLVQIFSASIFSRIGQSKKVTLTLYSLYRLFGAMPILIPFISNDIAIRTILFMISIFFYEVFGQIGYTPLVNWRMSILKVEDRSKFYATKNLIQNTLVMGVSFGAGILLDKYTNGGNEFKGFAIVFLNCGLRLSELVGINLSDLKIDNSEQTLKVTGKGNKQRIIYLNSAVCEAINAYIKIRPKLDKSNKDYNALFLSSRGKRISKRSVQNIIKSELVELVEAEGKESKKYHTHTLRHTGATLLYNEANANIFVLKIILGHESLDATQVYTHVSDKKLKELMQNFNILDRKE